MAAVTPDLGPALAALEELSAAVIRLRRALHAIQDARDPDKVIRVAGPAAGGD